MSKEETIQKFSSKQRLLRLQDLLKKYTEENHELTLDEILDKFYEVNEVLAGKKAIREGIRRIFVI